MTFLVEMAPPGLGNRKLVPSTAFWFVVIALWCLEKKNQHIGPLPHPLPSLALPDCIRSLITRLTSQIVLDKL